MDFEKTDNLKRIIEEEQAKHHAPWGYAGEFDKEFTAATTDPIKQQIDRIAEEVGKETDLYLICEMAKRWVERQRKPSVLFQGMIPLNPTTKKNSQKIITNPKTKRSMIIQSDAYKEYEKEAGWFLHNPKHQPINEPVTVKCLFYRDSERSCDLTNLEEAIDDILIKYGILADDNFKIIKSHDGSRVYIDRDRPRTEIEITRYTE